MLGIYPSRPFLVQSKQWKQAKSFSKLTIKTQEWRHCRSELFIINFEHIEHIFLTFLYLTLKTYMPVGYLNIPVLSCKRRYSVQIKFHFLIYFMQCWHIYYCPSARTIYSKKLNNNFVEKLLNWVINDLQMRYLFIHGAPRKKICHYSWQTLWLKGVFFSINSNIKLQCFRGLHYFSKKISNLTTLCEKPKLFFHRFQSMGREKLPCISISAINFVWWCYE